MFGILNMIRSEEEKNDENTCACCI